MTTRFEKPTFTYKGLELVDTSQSRVIVNFLFSAHNPNEAGLKSVTCSYELFVEGKKILTGNDIPLALNPKATRISRSQQRSLIRTSSPFWG
jgi:hypothetical protein